jgi:hypothetical protein
VLTKQRQALRAEARDLEARLDAIQRKSDLGTITEAEEAEVPVDGACARGLEHVPHAVTCLLVEQAVRPGLEGLGLGGQVAQVA